MDPKPASVGKTVAITLAVPAALEDFLYTLLHDIWGFDWATPRFIASTIFLAGSIAAGIMHHFQRKKEGAVEAKTNGEPVIGGPEPEATLQQ